MTNEEFLDELKEDKFFEDIQQQIDHRIAIINHFLANFSPQIMVNGQLVDFSKITALKPDINDNYNFTLMNQAYEGIKNKFKNK